MKSVKLNIDSRVVKEARLKILCVMLPGFESQSMYFMFLTAIYYYYYKLIIMKQAKVIV